MTEEKQNSEEPVQPPAMGGIVVDYVIHDLHYHESRIERWNGESCRFHSGFQNIL